MGPDIAMAASARQWPDRLHRFLLDHGGGRIVDRVMGPDQAVAGSFDVLLIDDVCSFLTPHLVTRLKGSGREVIGVFQPEDGSHAKRRLLECGIADVIETDATPEEFLDRIGQLLAHRATVTSEPESSAVVSVAVTGPCEGVGMTEVSIALSLAIAERAGTTLLDLDPRWPSVAQRLDLPVHPNIRTAIDRALHHPDRLDESFHNVGDLRVVGGRADGGKGSPISRHDTNALLGRLAAVSDVVVADAGPFGAVEGGLLREFDTVIIVGSASPVGVARLIRTAHSLRDSNEAQSHLALINQTVRGSFKRSELISEVASSLPDLAVSTLPFDRNLAAAAWDGRAETGRSFRRSVTSMATVVVERIA